MSIYLDWKHSKNFGCFLYCVSVYNKSILSSDTSFKHLNTFASTSFASSIKAHVSSRLQNLVHSGSDGWAAQSSKMISLQLGKSDCICLAVKISSI